MTFPFRWLLALAAVTLTAQAQSLLPSATLPLDSLSSFQQPAANWQLAGGIGGDPRHDKTLTPLPGHGLLLNIPWGTAFEPLTTIWEHGDLELDLDFLTPDVFQSSILLQGRYALDLTAGRRAPGVWQHLHLEFQAPRFDAAGKKIRNARFVKIAFNDFVTAEDVELTGPTNQVSPPAERPLGPLVLGDGGPVALRAIKYKLFDPALQVGVENLAYKFYAGEFWQTDAYAAVAPKSEGTPPAFAADAVEKTGKFALVFTGNFTAPRDGLYAFQSEGQEPLFLVVDGQPAVAPLDQGGSHAVNLTAGKHSFRLDFLHTSWRPPAFRLSVEGPGLASQTLAGRARAREPRTARQLLIEPPKDRVRLQRSFVPYDPRKRLYAINVGTPQGVHYSYDFETAALLRVWRGHFLDTFEMWDGRGENQIAKPAGAAITLNARPNVALLERSAYDWPVEPEPLWTSQGYTLEPDGQPVFLATLATLKIRDRIAAAPVGTGLTRTLNVSGRNTDWETWVLLAEADHIEPQPGGTGYVVGDRAYYIDIPDASASRPVVRTRNGRQQLVVPVTGLNVNKTITYTLTW